MDISRVATGNREQNGKRAGDAGFSAWLTKPVPVELLSETIHALCQRAGR